MSFLNITKLHLVLKKRENLFFSLFLYLLLYFIGISNSFSSTLVRIEPLNQELIYDEYVASGKFNLSKIKEYFAAGSGVVSRIHYKSGDSIKIGDVILSIEEKISELENDSAILDYKAKHHEFEKNQKLYESGLISAQSYRVAQAKFAEAKEKYLKHKKKIEKYLIKSNIKGVVGTIYVEEGSDVRSGERLLSIGEYNGGYVKLYLPEKLKPYINDSIVYIKTSKSIFEAKLESVSPFLEKDTGNFLVKIMAEDNEHLLHNSFVDVIFKLNTRKAYLVPEYSLIQAGGESYIFIVEGKKAKKIKVKTGLRINGKIEIIFEKNLNGMSYVKEGVIKLEDNALVDF